MRLTYLTTEDVPAITLSEEHQNYEWLSLPNAKTIQLEPYLQSVVDTLPDKA